MIKTRPFVLHTYIAERIVLPVVLAFAAGVLLADIAADNRLERQHIAQRTALLHQLQLECGPVYAPIQPAEVSHER